MNRSEKELELTEKQQEIKKEDKKAIKRFTIIMIFAFVLGIGVGIGSAFLKDTMGDASVKNSFLQMLKTLAIYGGYVYTTVLLVLSIVLYKKSRKEYTSWDEEDEEVLSRMETKLSYALWFSNLMMYGSYFFLSVGAWALELEKIGETLQQDKTGFFISLGAVFLHMFYGLVAALVITQKAVNLSKEINPEKQGSIYDMKFQDKWMENCDEAERYTSYKCSFKTFKVMQMVGVVLWLVCLVGQMSFGTGAFATIIVTIFMIIQTSVYSVQGIYFAKHPSEVMK